MIQFVISAKNYSGANNFRAVNNFRANAGVSK